MCFFCWGKNTSKGEKEYLQINYEVMGVLKGWRKETIWS